jgi:2-amino-4-hydroxy-6-hydroxymethyldihydropteridine diphosphokinase
MRAFIAVGTNLGDRWAHLAQAARGLASAPRTALVAASRVFESAPLGPPQPRYLNAVLQVETGLTPRGLLEVTQAIEAQAHRRRDQRWGARTLDLDLLLCGDLVVRERGLTVPHPGLPARRFVLAPLAQLAPGHPVPGTASTVAALLAALPPWDLVEVGLYPRP